MPLPSAVFLHIMPVKRRFLCVPNRIYNMGGYSS